MTRKDFNLIAATIDRLDVDQATRLTVAQAFADSLRSTNENFDRARFVQAATKS